jgi:PIN domain nuclease of toxin-antitoxin system
MPTSVLDACAMLAYIQNEPGAEVVEEILTRPGEKCVAHAVNLCEVYHKVFRKADEATAKAVMHDLTVNMGVELKDDMDPPFWNDVGKHMAVIRSSGNSIAMADCFAIALALKMKGRVVTSDHHEFEYVDKQGICPVCFFR